MKKNKNIYFLGGILIIALCIALPIFKTLAYQTDRDKKINNFTIGYNESSIIEEFEKPSVLAPGISFKKSVRVKNTTNSKCYVRIFAEINNQDAKDFVTMNIDTSKWSKKSDGYYYYNSILNEGEETAPLFSKVSISNNANVEVLKGLDIIVYEETAQAIGNNAQESFDALD